MAEIGIHDDNKSRIGYPGTGNHRPGKTDIDVSPQKSHRLPHLPSAYPLTGSVFGGRIDEQDIELQMTGTANLKDPFEQEINIPLFIKSGNYDGYFRQ
jgi:hypothetical protein